MAAFKIIDNYLVEITGHVENINGADFDARPKDVGIEIPFKPIGIGRPLSVEIITVYTGDFITGLFAGRKRDLLCVSAAKPVNAYHATPRAVNIVDRVADNTYLKFPAVVAGTPFIYYTKAVAFESMNITVELDGRSFNEDIFKTIAGLMRKAAGLPVFLPAAGYLLGGSELIKLAGTAGQEIFESKAFISETLQINLATPGMPATASRSFLLCRDDDKTELSQYEINYIEDRGAFKMRLMKGSQEYKGKAPYIIINVDGTERSSLESFTPALASSDLLARFYGSENGLQGASAVLQDAMQLYNDFNYRLKADKLESALENSMESADTDEFRNKKMLLEAYMKNINNDLLKKKLHST